MSRLNLDFSLETQAERLKFLHSYLQTPVFVHRPPTDHELAQMSDYLLWGKDENGEVPAKKDGLLTESKRSTWTKPTVQIESLEELMEQPTFNEAAILPLGDSAAKLKMPRVVFSRADALRRAPEELQDTLKSLFRSIDELELGINYYEIAHGKRTKDPREELLNRFQPEERKSIQDRAVQWGQYTYLKNRHHLVELRREQYTIRDSFAPQVQTAQTAAQGPATEHTIDFEAGIMVLPLGIKNQSFINSIIFQKFGTLRPSDIPTDLGRLISDTYWKHKNFQKGDGISQKWIDFRDANHVYELLQLYLELEDEADIATFESNLRGLMDTLEFYIEEAELSDAQREILDLKIKKVKNTDIAAQINQKYGKSYTSNYISTIFKQRIIPKINEAAMRHEKIIENIWYPENFKVCPECGRLLLCDAEWFMRKSRSKDGFAKYCKECDKKIRAAK